MHRFEKWRHSLMTAPDGQTVHDIMRQYISSILPSDVAQLPSSVQRMLSQLPVDLQAAAVELLQTELVFSGTPEASSVLHEVAHTFVAASTRLGQLHGRTPTAER